MDPISVSALAAVLTKVLEATADEGGRRLWKALTAIADRIARSRDARRRTREALDAAAAAPDDPARARRAAETLAAATEHDAAARGAVREWLDEAARTLGDHSVRNSVTGEVHGTVVQARDIHGGITFN